MLDNGKWVPTFPNARYLIGRREYEFWSTHKDEEQKTMLGDSVKPVFDAGLVQLVEMGHVISPEIRLTPSIGHTPGHVSVMIEPEDERQ
jgi:glyoxylase-like metal-dependent hydrolase (beta-lactamase superfamily II)